MRKLLKNMKSLPGVEIGETPEDFKAIAERSLVCREEVIYYLGSVEILMKAYEQAYEDDHYIPTRMGKNILVKMLAPDSPIMRKYQSGDAGQMRETRALPADVVLENSVMIHDDTVVFFAKDEKLFALSVTSPAVAATMKAMFHDMWRHGGT